jgi:PIN domain nuclease of toxin-antitoxin system
VKVNYLLDTNAWFRLMDRPDVIRKSVLKTLSGEIMLGLSTFSLLEVAQKNHKHELLTVSLEKWFEIALPPGLIQVFPLTPGIARKAYELGEDFHGDPADRVITATALAYNLTLVTSDRKLLAYDPLRSLKV